MRVCVKFLKSMSQVLTCVHMMLYWSKKKIEIVILNSD